MKRIVPLVLVVGGVGLALWFVARAQRPQPALPSAPQAQTIPPAAVAPTPPSPESAVAPAQAEGTEPVVYQFEDEAKMREFAGLWQSRQKTLLRLAVLQAYWDNEQSGAATLNTQLETQYHLNPANNYALDGEKRVLIERPGSAAPPESAPAEGQAAGAPASAEEGTVVHTFATEDEMKTFATLWQQRQGSGVRLAVLKSFWDEENTELTKLNGALTETYQLDVTKNYMLDANRRVIVERPAAAEPAPEAPPVQAPLLEQPAAP